MKDRYQIMCNFGNEKTASLKAPSDVSIVAERLGFLKIIMEERGNNKFLRIFNRFISLLKADRSIQNDSIILLQYPIYYKSANLITFLKRLKLKKKCKVITLFHDINYLRQKKSNNYEEEVFNTILKISDAYIAHNDVMKEYLASLGCSKEAIISLEVFDYLFDYSDLEKANYCKSLIIAGNLDIKKAGYLKYLGKMHSLHFDLYGINYDSELSVAANIEYHGAFPSSEVPSLINYGFGLVWDGDSIESCNGPTGEYLKINNPHKLSLYLLSGIPVVIWSQAAEAAFVQKNGVGICVDSLKDLVKIMDNFTADEYYTLVDNVRDIQKKISTGEYTKAALLTALQTLE